VSVPKQMHTVTSQISTKGIVDIQVSYVYARIGAQGVGVVPCWTQLPHSLINRAVKHPHQHRPTKLAARPLRASRQHQASAFSARPALQDVESPRPAGQLACMHAVHVWHLPVAGIDTGTAGVAPEAEQAAVLQQQVS
jgi:hypothetical protein